MLPALALHSSKPDSTLCGWAGPAKAALAGPGGVDLGKGRACLYQMGSMGSHKARPVPTRPVQQAGPAADWSPYPPLRLHPSGCGVGFWVCMSVAVLCSLYLALACKVLLSTPVACVRGVMCMPGKCTGSRSGDFCNPPPPSPPPPLPLSNMLHDKNGTAVHVANVLACYTFSMCMNGCISSHKLKLDLDF